MDFRQTLRDLARDPRWSTGEPGLSGRLLTEASAAALGVARVSIWRADVERSGIELQDLYIAAEARHETGLFLSEEACPAYFDAIRGARILAVDDVMGDPRTSPLGPAYMVPNGIGALMDAPIVVDGRLWGVVCHEHLGGPRGWTSAEQGFAASMGDLMAMAVQAERRRAAERALDVREREVQVALEAANMGDWSWDIARDQVRWSPLVGALLGRPPGWNPDGLAGYMAIVHPDDRAGFGAAIQSVVEGDHDTLSVEHRTIGVDGGIRWVAGRARMERDAAGQSTRLVGVMWDVTGRRQMEQRLAQADRLESLGRLAGGVAHDFNNLLAAIGGATELLERAELPPPQGRLLATIQRGVDRASELTARLLTFGGGQSASPRSVELRPVVRAAVGLARHLLGDAHGVDVDIPERLEVHVDALQLEQILMNLLINARDAMPEGGVVRITGAQGEGDDAPFAVLQVRDGGVGMSPETAARIFEPFFTTKSRARGTGLGLAITHGLVQDFGGRIEVESAVGTGTVFTVWLPLSTPGPRAAQPAEPASRAPARGLVVALIEDDEDILWMLEHVLTEEGHTVRTAATGPEGLALIRSWPEIELVVSDVLLPGCTGPEMLEALAAQGRNIPAVLISGYTPNGSTQALKGVPLLQKPFSAHELRGAIAEVMGRARS